MQKKRTFMTAPDMIVESESDEENKPPIVQQPLIIEQPKQDILDEYNQMLKEVLDAQRVVRDGTDDLEEIRRMIHQTKNNISSHIITVD